jgi:hypothetical protein
LYKNNTNILSELAELHQEHEEAVHGGWNLERKSHVADPADPAKKKSRLSTASIEKTACDSEVVGALYHQEVVPNEVLSGTAAATTAIVSTFAVATVRAMAQGLCPGSAAFSAPVISRGRLRGIDNRPAWLTRGLDDNNRLSGLAAPQPAVEHRPSISAALSVPISNITKNERGVDNRPAWMSRGFAPNDGPNDFTQRKVFSVNDELSGRGQEGRQLVQSSGKGASQT